MDDASSELACPRCGSAMIRRTRRADRADFWGCSRFPACRGTRELAAIAAVRPPTVEEAVAGSTAMPWDDPVWQERASAAGRSARAEGERRHARHRRSVIERAPSIIGRGIAIAVVGLALTSLGSSWVLTGWVLVLLAVVTTLGALFIDPASVRAWGIGAEGEERTARVLDPLRHEGFRVLHDRRMPHGRANIDHLVIGPTGVFVVETKSYAGRLRIRGGELYIEGRRKTAFADQVNREADAVRDVLDGIPARPILCIHRVEFPLFGRLEIDGVPIVGPRGLARTIRGGPTVLAADDVARLGDLAEGRLRPA